MIRYAITDPAYYSSDPEVLGHKVAELLRTGGVDMICLRDKSGADYEALAKSFATLRPRFPGVRFLLHTQVELAAKLGMYGVHLPSAAISRVPEAKEAGLWCVVSCHEEEDVLLAQRLGADAVTFSPVFETPGKGAPKGLEKLKEIKDKISIKLIALGGIVTPGQVEAVKRAGADGFASIRYFAKPVEGNENR